MGGLGTGTGSGFGSGAGGDGVEVDLGSIEDGGDGVDGVQAPVKIKQITRDNNSTLITILTFVEAHSYPQTVV